MITKWKTILISLLVLLLIIPAPLTAEDFAIEDLDPPDEYEKLLERYKEMAEIALRYRELYQDAEEDNRTLEARAESLMQQIERQEELIETQDELINDLLQEDAGEFALTAEYDYYFNNSTHEFKLGAEYRLPVDIPIF